MLETMESMILYELNKEYLIFITGRLGHRNISRQSSYMIFYIWQVAAQAGKRLSLAFKLWSVVDAHHFLNFQTFGPWKLRRILLGVKYSAFHL